MKYNLNSRFLSIFITEIIFKIINPSGTHELFVVPGSAEQVMTGIHLRIAAVDVRLIRINIIIIIVVLMVHVLTDVVF